MIQPRKMVLAGLIIVMHLFHTFFVKWWPLAQRNSWGNRSFFTVILPPYCIEACSCPQYAPFT
jgi:hypothetical protein